MLKFKLQQGELFLTSLIEDLFYQYIDIIEFFSFLNLLPNYFDMLRSVFIEWNMRLEKERQKRLKLNQKLSFGSFWVEKGELQRKCLLRNPYSSRGKNEWKHSLWAYFCELNPLSMLTRLRQINLHFSLLKNVWENFVKYHYF